MFLAGPGSVFTKQLASDAVQTESLCFGELNDADLGRWCPHANAATCLIPNFPDLLVDEQLAMSTAWASEEPDLYMPEDEEYEHTRDVAVAFQRYVTEPDDGTRGGELGNDETQETVSVFAGNQEGLAEFWARKLSAVEFPAAAALSGIVARLVGQFQCIEEGPSGYAMLTKRPGVALRRVGAFRMSESWWAVRHISTGVWTAVFTPEITYGLDARKMSKLERSDYLLYMICRLWSPVKTPNWGSGWPNKSRMVKLGKQLDRIFEKGEDVNPYEPPYEDDERLEEWETEMESIDEKELQELRENWERDNLTSIFFREIAGREMSQCLSHFLGSL